MSTTGNTPVIAAPVPENERMAFLPLFFGQHFILGETTVFTWGNALSPNYSGGRWTYFKLSNGGFFLAPVQPEKLRVQWHGNGFDDEMSANAFGVVTTLFALCHLIEIFGEERFVEQYHALREYALTHTEARLIFGAID